MQRKKVKNGKCRRKWKMMEKGRRKMMKNGKEKEENEERWKREGEK